MAQALAELCAGTTANPLKEIQTDHKAFQKTLIKKRRRKPAMLREMKNIHADQINLGIQYLVDKITLFQKPPGNEWMARVNTNVTLPPMNREQHYLSGQPVSIVFE